MTADREPSSLNAVGKRSRDLRKWIWSSLVVVLVLMVTVGALRISRPRLSIERDGDYYVGTFDGSTPARMSVGHRGDERGWLRLGFSEGASPTLRLREASASAGVRSFAVILEDNNTETVVGNVTETMATRQVHGELRLNPGDVAKPLILRQEAQRMRLEYAKGFSIGRRGRSITYTTRFPRFTNDNRFHEAISQFLESFLVAYATGTSKSSMTWEQIVEGIKVPTSRTNWVEIDVEIVWLSEESASMFATKWFDDASASHGLLSFTSYNFVWENDSLRRLELQDLFEPGSDWLKQLEAFCVRDLIRQGFPFVNARPELSEGALEDWCVTSDGIEVHFNFYNIAPESTGAFTVPIPSSELKPLLNHNGPARHLPW